VLVLFSTVGAAVLASCCQLGLNCSDLSWAEMGRGFRRDMCVLLSVCRVWKLRAAGGCVLMLESPLLAAMQMAALTAI